MSEPSPGRSRLVITIEAGEQYFFVPSESAIAGAKGIFVRNVELMVGSSVVIHVCKQQEAVSLPGIVLASYRDLGIAIEFKDKTGHAAQQIVTLLAA